MTRTELIHKLVTTFHLNMPERAMLELPIKCTELEAAVRQALTERGIVGCPLGELRQLNPHQWEIFREVEVGFSRYQEVRWSFDTLDEAVAAFVQQILNDHPPGTIDGNAIIA